MNREEAIRAIEGQLIREEALPTVPTWMELDKWDRDHKRLTLEALLVLLKGEP